MKINKEIIVINFIIVYIRGARHLKLCCHGEKSGATYRREKKQRMEEDKRLGSFMDGFLQRQSCEELCNDDAHGSGLDSIAHTTCAGNETRNSTNAGGTKHLQVALSNTIRVFS